MGASNRKGQLDNEKLEALKEQTNMNHGAIIQLYNEFQKECPSGKLNQQQLCKIYRLMFPNGNPTTFCKHLFRTFDLDKNGHIDFIEFLLAINITSDTSSESKIHWAFKIYDIDGNGYISQKEFNSVVKSIYNMFGNNMTKKTENDLKEKCATVFTQLDINRDDQVSIEEFEKLCLENEELKSLLVPEVSIDFKR